jgi:hypothetical protein
MNQNTSSSNQEQSSVARSNSSLRDNMKSKSIWLRLLFMIVMVFLYSLSRFVVGAIAVVQFFWILFTKEKNLNLMTLGQALATYAYQTSLYLTFNTEERPFPFDADWPN